MPLIVLFLALLALIALVPLLIPLSLILRYRAGTARRLARGWVATINFFGTVISTLIFVSSAALMNVWVPRALSYTAIGLAGGFVLGLLGLAASRWEATSHTLHFTPNRWLVLAITLVVTARIAYGFWRGWDAWRSTPDATSWLAASGAAGTLGAGALILGYFLAYWGGVRRRVRKHRDDFAPP